MFRPIHLSIPFALVGLVACGGKSGGESPSVPQTVAAPVITGLSPATLVEGSPAQTLTLTGTGFDSEATVSFNGANRPTQWTGSTQMAVTLTAEDLATAGSFPVILTNPADKGGASAPLAFSVTALPAPVITSLSPATLVEGSPAQTLTLTGTGFDSEATVSFNGANRPTQWTGSTQMAVTLTAEDLATAGSFPVILTNPANRGGASAPLAFTVAAQPAPTFAVSSLFPPAFLVGAGAQSLVVNGVGFTAQSTVALGGQARPTTFLGANQLLAELTLADLATAASLSVTVVDGTAATAAVKLPVAATLPTTGTPTLTVDLGNPYRDVTRVASGSLYGLVEDGVDTSTGLFATPSALLDPLKPLVFRQPAPGHHHLPNEETIVVSDAVKVAGKAAEAGAQVSILMTETYVDFPYVYSGWTDWSSRVDAMFAAVQAAGATNIYGWEIWNEPNWTWDTASWGEFDAFWKETAEYIRTLDPTAKLIGPSIDMWDKAWMKAFLTFARDNNVLPDIMVWHELGKPEGNVYDTPKPWYIADHMAQYRALETSLGIEAIPVSINEFAVQREEAVPGGNIRYFAQFERTGVESACAAFWFRPGRLSNILTDKAEANGGWWLYKWYGDLAGKMVMATSSRPRQLSLEGIASLDPATLTSHVLFGGTDGSAVIALQGLGTAGYAGTVHIKAEMAPYYGADTPVAEATALFEGDFPVVGDRVLVPFQDLDKSYAYHLLITETGTTTTRYEAEAAQLTQATVARHSAASGDAYLSPLEAAGSAATFTVKASGAGTYALEIRYANGATEAASQNLVVNGGTPVTVAYPSTSAWTAGVGTGMVKLAVALLDGANTIQLVQDTGSVELDYLQMNPAGTFRHRLEAERATLSSGPKVYGSSYTSGGAYVGYIDTTAYVEFSLDDVPSAGTYTLEIGYCNGSSQATQTLTINGAAPLTLTYPSTGGWGGDCPNFGTRQLKTLTVPLNAGSNTLRFTAVTGSSAELDYVEIR